MDGWMDEWINNSILRPTVPSSASRPSHGQSYEGCPASAAKSATPWSIDPCLIPPHSLTIHSYGLLPSFFINLKMDRLVMACAKVNESVRASGRGFGIATVTEKTALLVVASVMWVVARFEYSCPMRCVRAHRPNDGRENQCHSDCDPRDQRRYGCCDHAHCCCIDVAPFQWHLIRCFW